MFGGIPVGKKLMPSASSSSITTTDVASDFYSVNDTNLPWSGYTFDTSFGGIATAN